MAQKIIHWLLIALILSLGFGQLLRFDFFGIPLYVHDFFVICLLCLQGLTLKVKIPLSLKIFLVGLSLGWLRALTLYPVSSLLIPSLYTLRLLAYLMLYLSLKQQKITIPRVIFFISGLTTLVIGLMQYFVMPDMRIFKYLGWDDHLSRLTLPHFDPTFTAVMLGLALLLLPLKYWYIGILFSLGILLTYARSAWLSLIVTATFFIKSKRILLLAVCCMFLFILFLPKKFGEGTNLLRTYSITSRFTSDLTIIKSTGWNLLIGQGMNTFPRNTINNSYLYLLATTGILGLVGWGMFLLSLYKNSHHKPMLIFFCLASLFNNVMFYPFALLWVLLIESIGRKNEQ